MFHFHSRFHVHNYQVLFKLKFIYPFEQNRFTKLSYLEILLRLFVSRLLGYIVMSTIQRFEFIWREEFWWKKNQFGVLVDNFVALCDCEGSSLCKANCETVNLPGCDGSVEKCYSPNKFCSFSTKLSKMPLAWVKSRWRPTHVACPFKVQTKADFLISHLKPQKSLSNHSNPKFLQVCMFSHWIPLYRMSGA